MGAAHKNRFEKRKRRLQKDKLTEPVHQIIQHLLIAVACNKTFANHYAQVSCKGGIRVVNGLVLAFHAANLRRQITGALFKLRIVQNFVRVDCTEQAATAAITAA